MCLCFFGDAPVDDDARRDRPATFKTGMQEAPCKDPLVFCASFCCFPCTNCFMRHKALEGKMDDYQCCQGYYDCMCFKAGAFGDKGNPVCLCLEGLCCASCAVSSTRMYVMDKYALGSDPCDNRIIRFNNFMQMLACICDILAYVSPECRDARDCVRFIADLVFMIMAGCMNAQVHYELVEREKTGTLGGGGSGGGAPTYAAAPKAEPPMDNRQPQYQQQQQQQQQQYQPQQQQYQQQPQYGQQQPQQVYATAVPVVAQQRTFAVTIPEGVYAGTQLQVQAPTGQMLMFAVPPGASFGQEVLVPY